MQLNIKLSSMAPNQAKESGYEHITIPIYPKTEQHIIQSIEKSMKGIDAIWIDYGNHIELGRKKGEIARRVAYQSKGGLLKLVIHL